MMSGIAEVARRAGVSKSTASRALSGRGYVSDDTRARVEAAAQSLGYVPSTNAVSLATGRTRTIGVITPHAANWFFGEVLEGIQSALIARDFDLALYTAAPGSPERHRMFDAYLGRRRFDGLITIGVEPDENELERIAAVGKPLVSIGSYDVGTTALSVDDRDVARVATEHVLGLGHHDVAFLGGVAADVSHSHGDKRRLQGYADAMTSAGLRSRIRHAPSDVSMPAGYEAAVALLADPRDRPTAIVAVCDEVAIGAIIAARRMGVSVPDRLSVVGIDDHPHAEMFSLTTIRQVPREQGSRAVELLVDHLDDADLASHREWAPNRLVIRGSTTSID